jgi:hypothetical protein
VITSASQAAWSLLLDFLMGPPGPKKYIKYCVEHLMLYVLLLDFLLAPGDQKNISNIAWSI